MYALIPMIVGVISLKNISLWQSQEMIRKGLFWAGIGLFSWGTGGLIWLYYSFFENIILPYPSIADLFYLPGALFYSLGVIYFARASGSDLKLKKMSAKIFVVTSTIVISVVSYYVLVTIARGGTLFDPESSILKNFLNIAYPCMDFVGLTIAVLVTGISLKNIVPKYRIALVGLTCGLVLMFVSDSLLTYFIIQGIYYTGCLCDLSFCVAILTFTFGVLGFCGERVDQIEHKIDSSGFCE